MKNCDSCDGTDYTPENPMVYGVQPRPSDPSELCAVLAGHQDCFLRGNWTAGCSAKGGWATAEQWNEWMETDEAKAAGVLFLSL